MNGDEDGRTAGDVTRALRDVAAGESGAKDRLWELVYDELRVIARRFMRAEHSARTLQPTALVNEAFVRVFGDDAIELRDRQHFRALAARAMRRVLVDRARERLAQKRGGELQRVSLADVPGAGSDGVDVLALHAALERLAGIHERQARVVELRYFGGLTINEAATELGVSPDTVKADWVAARTWLYQELAND